MTEAFSRCPRPSDHARDAIRVGLRGLSAPIRVMVEQGKKKAVASSFDWPGWDRGAKLEDDALAVLARYRPRYARVAELAGLGDEFLATGQMKLVERVQGTGMTDFYTLSARSAGPEQGPMSEAECEKKLAYSEPAGPTSTTSPHGSQQNCGRARAAGAGPGQDRPSHELC